MVLVRRVREVQHAVFLQSPCCYCGIHQRVVEVQLVYGERHAPVEAAHHDATPAVVVVLVPDIDYDATVCHLHELQRRREGGKNRYKPLMFTSIASLEDDTTPVPRATNQHQGLSPHTIGSTFLRRKSHPHSLQLPSSGGSNRT